MTGSTLTQPRFRRPRNRENRKTKKVYESIREQPGLSTRKRSAISHLPRISPNRIPQENLYLHNFKIQIVQSLKPRALAKRLQCSDEMLERSLNFNHIFFCDGAHFHLNDNVNRQNCKYWSDTYPRLKVTVETALLPNAKILNNVRD